MWMLALRPSCSAAAAPTSTAAMVAALQQLAAWVHHTGPLQTPAGPPSAKAATGQCPSHSRTTLQLAAAPSWLLCHVTQQHPQLVLHAARQQVQPPQLPAAQWQQGVQASHTLQGCLGVPHRQHAPQPIIPAPQPQQRHQNWQHLPQAGHTLCTTPLQLQLQQLRAHSSMCLQQHRQLHDQSKPPLTQQPHTQPSQPAVGAGVGTGPTAAASSRPAQSKGRLPGSTLTTLPNLLSLSRVAMGPWLAYSIAVQQWPVAVALTAAAGASDWLDGYLARWLGHTSKLGSYLDPVADKVFVATAVGTLGYAGMVPGWLAVLVVGRDSAQVCGMFWYRLRMFGGVWPGAAAFFDVDHAVQVGHAGGAPSSSGSSSSSSSSSSGPGGEPQQQAAAAAAGGLPTIRPLLISKANTALVMALVACCVANEWQGLPGADVLAALELAAAGTTLASAGAYAHLHYKGQLLAAAPSEKADAAADEGAQQGKR